MSLRPDGCRTIGAPAVVQRHLSTKIRPQKRWISIQLGLSPREPVHVDVYNQEEAHSNALRRSGIYPGEAESFARCRNAKPCSPSI